MRWYQVIDVGNWIVNVLQAVAWPGALLIIFFVLRDPLIGIIRRIVRIKYGDSEILLERVEEKAAALELSTTSSSAPDSSPTDVVFSPRTNSVLPEFTALREVAKTAPELAMIGGWNLLESELRMAATRAGHASKATYNAYRLLHELHAEKVLGPDVIEVLQDLRRIKNRIAHNQSMLETTTDEALRYLDVVDDVIGTLRAMGD